MKERIPEELRRLGRKEEENLLAFAAERSVSMMQAYCNREADVKSIKEGDVSVTFAESRAETELLADFRTELDRFRRADW